MSELPKHAKFSPSGAKRWMNCLGSLTLQAYAPKGDDDNRYSVEGTAAHALAAYCLNEEVEPYMLLDMDWSKIPDYPTEAIAKFPTLAIDLAEKREQTVADITHFVSYCFSLTGGGGTWYHGTEDRVKATSIDPELCYGTADRWSYHGATKTLYVVDYKNGFDPVPPDDPQLLIYATAVIETQKLKVEKVVLVVVQPNGGGNPVKKAEMTLGELQERLQPAVTAAAGYRINPIQPTNPGTWCKWCKSKPVCVSHRDQVGDVETKEVYSDDELLLANTRIPAIKQWMKTISEATYSRLMAGASPKAVGGMLNMSSPNRQYIEYVKEEIDGVGVSTPIDEYLKREVGDKAFTKPAPISPAQLEKLPGGKAVAMKCAFKPKGNLVLAGLDSKKPHVTPETTKERLTAIATG